MTALLHAAREGHIEAAVALLEWDADVNQVSAGDHTSPLLMAALNGQFDLALIFLEHGADPGLTASTDGVSPLFAVLQTQWAPRSNYPQPRAQDQQQAEYLDVLKALLEAGADPNVRLNTHLWYWEYGLTKMGIDLTGATPFWRAAFAQDLPAMKLLAAHGADPNIPTRWPEVGMRERRQQDGRQQEDSALPYIPEGAPSASPIHAAAGGGYLGLGAFSVRNAPDQFLPAVKYLVEEHGADVNLSDSWAYRPLHYAASRGDNVLIEYLVSQGADVTAITRLGQSTADMARGGAGRLLHARAVPGDGGAAHGSGLDARVPPHPLPRYRGRLRGGRRRRRLGGGAGRRAPVSRNTPQGKAEKLKPNSILFVFALVVALASSAAVTGCAGEHQAAPASASGSAAASDAPITKGGDDRTGQYEVVEGWWKSGGCPVRC